MKKWFLVLFILLVSSFCIAITFEKDTSIVDEVNNLNILFPNNITFNVASTFNGTITLNDTNYSVSSNSINTTINFTNPSNKTFEINSNETITLNFSLINGNFYSVIYNGSVINTQENESFSLDLITSFTNLSINYVPVVSSLTLVPLPTETSDNISIVNVTTDAENNTITNYSTMWYKDGVEVVAFRNETSVNYTNTTQGDTWTASLRAYDGYGWSLFVNSSTTTIGDNTSPLLTNDILSDISGLNNAPFSIFVDIVEAGQLFSSLVEVQDPNGVKTNFSLSLLSGSTYVKIYSPSTDGVYRFKFYAVDGSGNTAELNSTLTYTDLTSSTTGGDGGGATTSGVSKVKCDFDINPASVKLSKSNILRGVTITNNEDFTINFNYELESDTNKFLDALTIVNKVLALTKDESGEFGINLDRFFSIDEQEVFEGNLIISSSECSDVEVPVIFSPVTDISIFDVLSGDVTLLDYIKEPIWSATSSLRDTAPELNIGLLFLFVWLIFFSMLILFSIDSLKKKKYLGFIVLGTFITIFVSPISAILLINLVRVFA